MKKVDIPFELLIDITRSHNLIFLEDNQEEIENLENEAEEGYVIIKKNNYMSLLNLLKKEGFNKEDDIYNIFQTNIKSIILTIHLIMQNSIETAEQIFVISQIRDVKIKSNMPVEFVKKLLKELKQKNKFFKIFVVVKPKK